MRTLVLNAGYEPMQIISWQRAICLVISAKAEVIAQYDHLIRSVSAQMPLPSIVRLKTYVNMVSRIGIVRCSRKNILLRDDYQCQYCTSILNSTNTSIDHVLPRSRGGRTTWNNVVACCSSCNSKKGNQTPIEAQMPLLRKPARPTWMQIMDFGRSPVSDDWLRFLDKSA